MHLNVIYCSWHHYINIYSFVFLDIVLGFFYYFVSFTVHEFNTNFPTHLMYIHFFLYLERTLNLCFFESAHCYCAFSYHASPLANAVI